MAKTFSYVRQSVSVLHTGCWLFYCVTCNVRGVAIDENLAFINWTSSILLQRETPTVCNKCHCMCDYHEKAVLLLPFVLCYCILVSQALGTARCCYFKVSSFGHSKTFAVKNGTVFVPNHFVVTSTGTRHFVLPQPLQTSVVRCRRASFRTRQPSRIVALTYEH